MAFAENEQQLLHFIRELKNVDRIQFQHGKINVEMTMRQLQKHICRWTYICGIELFVVVHDPITGIRYCAHSNNLSAIHQGTYKAYTTKKHAIEQYTCVR